MQVINKRTGAELFEIRANNMADVTAEIFEAGMQSVGAEWNDDIACITINGKNHDYRDVVIAEKVPYRTYKTQYSTCETKKGSYNPDDKTIVIYHSVI